MGVAAWMLNNTENAWKQYVFDMQLGHVWDVQKLGISKNDTYILPLPLSSTLFLPYWHGATVKIIAMHHELIIFSYLPTAPRYYFEVYGLPMCCICSFIHGQNTHSSILTRGM